MRFWELREPPGSDYKHVHVNGKLNHPYRLPQVRCEACGATVSHFDAVLPYECPESMRNHSLLTDEDAEVPMKEFRKLEREIVAELRKIGVKKPRLIPSAFLQPCFLDVPSVPTSDFLWSDLSSGLSSIVVGERVRELLLDQARGGVAFCPVSLRRVGKRSGRSSPRIPKRGEPEDMMQRHRTGQTRGTGPYYQLVITAQSSYPPGTEPGPICRICGEELEQDWTGEVSRARQRWRTQQEAWNNLAARTVESVWGGTPIFRLAGRGTELVTEELKTRLEEMKSTNVSFREFPRNDNAH